MLTRRLHCPVALRPPRGAVAVTGSFSSGSLLLAASLSDHSSAASGIAAWLRLLTEPRDPPLV